METVKLLLAVFHARYRAAAGRMLVSKSIRSGAGTPSTDRVQAGEIVRGNRLHAHHKGAPCVSEPARLADIARCAKLAARLRIGG